MKMYKNLTKDIDNIANSISNCCKKGCSYCCYQMIEVYDFEKEEIIVAVNNLPDCKKSKVKNNLNKWFDFFNDNTPNNKVLDENDTIRNLFRISKKEKCPLLIDNMCSIYENRPLACRVHSVEDFPNLCKLNAYRESSNKSRYLRAKLVEYIIHNFGRRELLFLPFIVSEVITTDRMIKPLKKIFFP